MERRDFMRKAALLAAGFSIARPASGFSARLLAKTGGANRFSLSLLTDAPVVAIEAIEQLLKFLPQPEQNLLFTEHRLAGQHIGDIAVVENGRLLNFRQEASEFSSHVRDLSRLLGLPKKLNDPVLLAACKRQQGTLPKKLSVFHDNTLIEQLALHDPLDYAIDGAKGSVTLAIENHSARITQASCRHKTCMQMGSVARCGQHLVCIPNRIRISIEGGRESEVDGIVY